MNHLAHVFLAGRHGHAQLGGLLGDFWRGAPDPRWPPALSAGVALHRKIDVYTDSHPFVMEARRSFDSPLRRYAGILLDMYFDHALARDWSRYSDESLAELSARTLDLVAASGMELPADLRRFARYMRSQGLFVGYARRDAIEQALGGISQRLRHDNPLAAAGSALWQRASVLDETFARFFPDLIGYAREQRRLLAID